MFSWVYGGNSVERWLSAHQHLVFWLDYWMLLHDAEGSPLWVTRPIGSRTLATALKRTSGERGWILRSQLRQELLAMEPLTKVAPGIPRPPKEINITTAKWSTQWLQWAEGVMATDPKVIIAELIENLASTLAHGDLFQSAYITRRLAAELADTGCPAADAVSIGYEILHNDQLLNTRPLNAPSLADAFARGMVPTEKRSWSLELDVAPVGVAKKQARSTISDLTPILTEDQGGVTMLRAVRCRVDARNAHEAVLLAIELAASYLDRLAIVQYVRTRVHGTARIVAVDAPDGVSGGRSHVMLPQPFWRRLNASRAIPSIVPNYQQRLSVLTEGEARRVGGALWHLSQSITAWPADAHAAGALCWQGLEALMGERRQGAQQVARHAVSAFLPVAIREGLEYFASGVRAQHWALRTRLSGYCSDWRTWNPEQEDILAWSSRLVSRRLYRGAAEWKRPPLSAALVDPAVGLMSIFVRKSKTPSSEMWLDRRLESDLLLLYGHRNEVVHAGRRPFSTRTSIYLARVATEILVTLINSHLGCVPAIRP